MAQAQSKSQPPLKKVLADAGKKALGGGIAGALAMVVQVVALMWMRTTINFQHKYGMSTGEALAALEAVPTHGRIWAVPIHGRIRTDGDARAAAQP